MACLHGDSAGRDSKYPAEVLKEHWHGDEAVERVLKAVSNPTDTNSLWAATPRVILPALAPASAASKLMRPMQRLGVAEALQLLSRFNHHYPLQHAQ